MSAPKLLTAVLRERLLANGRQPANHVPVVKLFSPVGAATWLATELDEDDDILFGLADLGMGCPELGSFSLEEIAALQLPLGLRIERDLHFRTDRILSVWAETARSLGSISAAEQQLRSPTG